MKLGLSSPNLLEAAFSSTLTPCRFRLAFRLAYICLVYPLALLCFRMNQSGAGAPLAPLLYCLCLQFKPDDHAITASGRRHPALLSLWSCCIEQLLMAFPAHQGFFSPSYHLPSPGSFLEGCTSVAGK